MIDHEQSIDSDDSGINNNSQIDGLKWKNLKKTLTDTEILAQALLFVNAGHETTSYALSFIAYNLALYPEYQETLLDEIDDVLGKHVIYLRFFSKFQIIN